MGKRKHRHKEDEIARKIRRLERKMHKVKRRRRRSSSSSEYSSSVSISDSGHSTPEVSHEDVYLTESDKEDITYCESERDNASPSKTGQGASAPQSDSPAALDPNILSLLGEEPEKEESFDPEIQKDLANRWTDILVNGLKEETKKEIFKSYKVPENFKIVKPPTLNEEIKAAVNENALKRDCILTEKQKLLSCAISCIANITTKSLTSSKDASDDNNHLKALSDAGRLLCHIHYTETQTRRNFLLACLNKDVKDNIKNIKRDQLLFGSNLPDKLKSMKAISRTGAELKSTVNKAKPQPKSKQAEASTSRALNWRGPPPQPPPPRRATAKQSSTAGGRKQQPARRPPDRPAAARYSGRPHRR